MAPRGMWWVPAPSFFPWWLAENKMLPLLCAVMSHTSTDPKQSSQPILDWNLQNCEPKSLPPPLSHLGTLGNKHPIKAAIRLTTGKEKKSIIVVFIQPLKLFGFANFCDTLCYWTRTPSHPPSLHWAQPMPQFKCASQVVSTQVWGFPCCSVGTPSLYRLSLSGFQPNGVIKCLKKKKKVLLLQVISNTINKLERNGSPKRPQDTFKI